MQTTSVCSLAKRPTSLLTHANAFNSRTLIGPVHTTNETSACSLLPGRLWRHSWVQSSKPRYGKSVRLSCLSQQAQHTTSPQPQDRNQCGVAFSITVYEIVHHAIEDSRARTGPGNLADAACLLLACLKHPDCSDLRRQMECSGVWFDQLQAVITVGQAMQQGIKQEDGKDCSYSKNEDAQHNNVSSPSTGMQGILMSAMQHAVSKGSDVVQVKDLLYCLTSNRDAVCLTINPLYFAVSHMFGPVDADKMMDTWYDLLSTTTMMPRTKQHHLPNHISETTNKTILTAIYNATTTADIANLLAAFDRAGWVPNVSVSTKLWKRLTGLRTSDVSNGVAAKLLAGLATMPLPPSLPGYGIKLAKSLNTILKNCPGIDSSECSKHDHHSPWLPSVDWKMVFNALACCTRLEEAFPNIIAAYQSTRNFNTSINMVRHEASRGGSTYALIATNFKTSPAEAYLALRFLQKLGPGSAKTTAAPLPYPVLSCSKPAAQAAFLAMTLTLKPWSTAGTFKQEHFYKMHLPTLLDQQPVVDRLSHNTWSTSLLLAGDHEYQHLIQSKDMQRALHSRLGYIWKGSNAVLINARMEAIQQHKDWKDGDALKSPFKQWLWEDVLSTIASSDSAFVIRTLLKHAKELQLVTDETGAKTCRALQQALGNVTFGHASLQSFLSTLPECNMFAAMMSSNQSSQHDAQTPAISNSFANGDITLPDIHASVATKLIEAGFFEAEEPDGAVKQQPTSFQTTDILNCLISEEDQGTAIILAVEAVQSGQADQLEVITWLCMTFDNTKMSTATIEQLSEQLLAAVNICMAKQGTSTGIHQYAILQRWATLAKQHVSLSIYREFRNFNTFVSSYEVMAFFPALPCALKSLVFLGQTNIWLGHLPCHMLNNIHPEGDGDLIYSMYWAMFVWSLSVAWRFEPDDNSMEVDGEELPRLQLALDVVAQEGPAILTALMLLATACQFQEQLDKGGSSLPPIIHQLFTASAKSAVSSVAAHASKLKDASDDDLLHLSALLLRLVSGGLPTETNRDKVDAGLKALLDEMERRMLQQNNKPKPAAMPAACLVGRQVEVLVNPRPPH